MIAYVTLSSTDFAASAHFYDRCLATLGIGRLHDYSEGGWIGYGKLSEKNNPATQCLWLGKTPFNGAPASVGNGSMMALQAASQAEVDAFYAAAMANGGSSEGAPGLRENYGPGMYLAYVRDPMGNKWSIIARV